MPRPAEWLWDRLGPEEVERRLAAVRATSVTLERWTADLEAEREEARKQVWATLGEAKLQEYTKTGGWKPAGVMELEAMGKELALLQRLSKQAEAAIASIERRKQGGVLR